MGVECNMKKQLLVSMFLSGSSKLKLFCLALPLINNWNIWTVLCFNVLCFQCFLFLLIFLCGFLEKLRLECKTPNFPVIFSGWRNVWTGGSASTFNWHTNISWQFGSYYIWLAFRCFPSLTRRWSYCPFYYFDVICGELYSIGVIC